MRTGSTRQGASSELLSSVNSNSCLCSCSLGVAAAGLPFAFSVLQYPFSQSLCWNAWCGFWFPGWNLAEQYPCLSVSLTCTLPTLCLSLGVCRSALVLRFFVFVFVNICVLIYHLDENFWKQRKNLESLDSGRHRFKIWFSHFTKQTIFRKLFNNSVCHLLIYKMVTNMPASYWCWEALNKRLLFGGCLCTTAWGTGSYSVSTNTYLVVMMMI